MEEKLREVCHWCCCCEGSIPQEPPENHAGCLPPWAGAEQLFAISCPLWLKVDMVMQTYLPPGLGCIWMNSSCGM